MKRNWPRISQLLFLALFLVLFVMTEYRGHDQINVAVNSFFRSDPLVLAGYLLAAKSWNWLLLPAGVTVAANLLLGRFFCAWICPLGTLLDLLRVKKTVAAPPWLLSRGPKQWLLLTLLFASLFNLNLAGLLDPLAILLRGLTFFLYPLLGLAAREGWVELYGLIGEKRDSLAPLYGLLRDHLLPFRDAMYPLAFFSAVLLLGILVLERAGKRTWCRCLCPLGTLLGWLGKVSLFKRLPVDVCGDCGRCRDLCPMRSNQGRLDEGECIVCMNCERSCRDARVSFRLAAPLRGAGPLLSERRALLGGMAAGLLLTVPVRFRTPEMTATLLRPPGVRNEAEFLKKCVRCGECIKVCLKNALYPAAWQSGVEGFYTPYLIPRLGYCEYNCTLCGQVCPTGAIPLLPVEEKRREVIGKAVFDKNHCLPFAKKIDCIVCEEHCPIPDKAIRSREVTVAGSDGVERVIKEPYIVDEICNGCGICEYVCPLEARAGVQVMAVKSRNPLAGSVARGDSTGSGYAVK